MYGFDDVLAEAAAAVSQEYFLLPVRGSDPVYRERVYCYELYHQMRCRWPEQCDYFLNGEVDKQQHPYFEGPGYLKPDFLVHVPGTNANFAAIEVKPPGAAAGDIRKDLRTLIRFQQWYERGLYLFYGVQPDEALERIAACDDNSAELGAIDLLVDSTPDTRAIELLVHSAPGTPAERVAWVVITGKSD